MDVGSTEIKILQVTTHNHTSIKVIRNYIY